MTDEAPLAVLLGLREARICQVLSQALTGCLRSAIKLGGTQPAALSRRGSADALRRCMGGSMGLPQQRGVICGCAEWWFTRSDGQ